MPDNLSILIVEDSEDDALLIVRELRQGGLEFDHLRVETADSLKKALGERAWDAVISDYVMPHFSGLEALRITRDSELDIPFIIVSGKIGEDIAVEAMRAGANDYVLKTSLARLAPAVEREMGEAQMRQCKLEAEAELKAYREHLEEIVALRTEELRVANLGLERASQAKSAYLSQMSHELRTPLNSIIGFTDIILRGMAGPLTEEQEKQLRMVLSSAKHQLALVNDLLDLARIESGQLGASLEPIRLSEFIEEVAALAEPLFAEKGLAFSVESDSAPPVLVSDKRLVQQVLFNLLGNAAKFTTSGSVTLLVSTDANRVCFSVNDTGVGIAPDDLERVFEQFQRVSDETGVSPGTGLGLTISREIAALLGGTLTVSSEVGVGSRFALTLPLADPVAIGQT